MMKKLLKYIAAAALCVAAVSCSQNSSYDPAKANALSEKVINGDDISQEEYSQMISQCEGAAAIISERFDKLIELKKKGDTDKLREAFESCTDDDIMNAAENFQTLGEHLQRAPLDSVNSQRWHEVEPQARELVTKMFAVFQ